MLRNWRDGKKWVYSITYDEGLARLMDYCVPIHRKYGIPGHVALVAQQIGVARNVPGSSYDGMMVLSAGQIHGLCNEGWGVSCHSMTHASITEDNARFEVTESRQVIERALGMKVDMFCVPGDNDGYPASLAHAGEAGYAAILTIYDDVNPRSPNLLRLCRCPLHTEYPPPFFSAFDPYKRLQQASECGGWIIDYCHCPVPGRPIHPWKDCTSEQLEERFRAVLKIGGDDVWLAEPGDVVRHLLGEDA